MEQRNYEELNSVVIIFQNMNTYYIYTLYMLTDM